MKQFTIEKERMSISYNPRNSCRYIWVIRDHVNKIFIGSGFDTKKEAKEALQSHKKSLINK